MGMGDRREDIIEEEKDEPDTPKGKPFKGHRTISRVLGDGNH
jgi:hypothetical protein